MSQMFHRSKFNQPIGQWQIGRDTYVYEIFKKSKFFSSAPDKIKSNILSRLIQLVESYF
jgi:hypothetical protein